MNRIPARRVPRDRFSSSGGGAPGIIFGGGAPGAHTHLEADITDLKTYLQLAGGTMTGGLVIGGGNTLTLKDSTNADSVVFTHDGTHFRGTFVNTTDFILSGLSTGVLEIDGGLRMSTAAPLLAFIESDASANNKIWDIYINGEVMKWRIFNDAFASTVWLQIDRTGLTPDKLAFIGTDTTFSGTLKCGKFGANSTTPIAKPSVTGSRAGNAALANLLTELANYGLITDSSTA